MDLQWERNFREQMRRRREALGESQSSFARILSARGLQFHQPTVQRVEDGSRAVRLDEAHVIAAVLGTTVATMVASSSDTTVDATMAVDRIRRQAAELEEAVRYHYSDWAEDWAPVLEALESSLDLSGATPAPIARWLGAWVARAAALHAELRTLHDSASAFDAEWEPGSFVDNYWSEQAETLLTDKRWSDVPEDERPGALAALSTQELDDYLRVRVAEEVELDGEHREAH